MKSIRLSLLILLSLGLTLSKSSDEPGLEKSPVDSESFDFDDDEDSIDPEDGERFLVMRGIGCFSLIQAQFEASKSILSQFPISKVATRLFLHCQKTLSTDEQMSLVISSKLDRKSLLARLNSTPLLELILPGEPLSPSEKTVLNRLELIEQKIEEISPSRLRNRPKSFTVRKIGSSGDGDFGQFSTIATPDKEPEPSVLFTYLEKPLLFLLLVLILYVGFLYIRKIRTLKMFQPARKETSRVGVTQQKAIQRTQ